jgi:hypothetical protein
MGVDSTQRMVAGALFRSSKVNGFVKSKHRLTAIQSEGDLEELEKIESPAAESISLESNLLPSKMIANDSSDNSYAQNIYGLGRNLLITVHMNDKQRLKVRKSFYTWSSDSFSHRPSPGPIRVCICP